MIDKFWRKKILLWSKNVTSQILQSIFYCISIPELDNTRLQTHTEYKTLTPIWNRILNMPIGDIHSILHVSVYDEDKNHKSEFLGTFAIPLLNIESGFKRWFALRDKKLRERAKGNNPQILLEMTLVWNRYVQYIYLH